ncbi:ubiquitin carboxyl-terminal hydrolase 2-like isoform X2 [Magnolia sinica]|uniref:ubiquitin carboxyl-terminal hydrolase 2-like isoform X2 n=1 Tax=Magnolia sinica TaxID=86752 RepID=UPI002658AB53|nr:ubiquitin carboxyl-terminal hydrolase 2-like isoform X2 [Magnolia sinica]
MGKKMKRKTRSAYKDKRVSSNSLLSISEHSNPTVEIMNEGVSAGKERKACNHIACNHIDNSVDLDKISWNISSSDNLKCKDCRDGHGVDRRAGKGKGKQARKKGTGSADTKSELKCLWVCLSCGHVACGGAVGDSTPLSHALRHAKQTRHPSAVQLEDPLLCWCFSCNSLIPVEKPEENGGRNNILFQAHELIKGWSMKGAVVDVEDVWFGGGNVEERTTTEIGESSISNTRGYKVRGLPNLGNTCFFNSVMQNLLAIDLLRVYFMDLDRSVGPLTMALRKLFTETNIEVDFRNGTNPKSLFGCICSKAPQFRGYQQQDSHELLRYLLDGLHTEELSARKSFTSSSEDGVASNMGPTFVDVIFGGQLSSTVCCTECGHSSIVYEPFLDLSLPVPTKKPPPRKAVISQPKKKKQPLKEQRNKGGKNRESKNADTAPLSAQCATRGVSLPLECRESSSTLPSGALTSIAPAKEQAAALVTDDNLPWLDFIGQDTPTEQTVALAAADDSLWLDYIGQDTPKGETASLAAADGLSWLDYIGQDTAFDDASSVSQSYDISAVQDSECKQVFQNEDTTQYSIELPSDVCTLDMEPKAGIESVENRCIDELPLHVQDSEVLLLPYKDEVSAMGEREGMTPDCQNPTIVASEDAPSKDLIEAASSINGWGEAEQDFDGFGDLFHEPETVSDPKMESSLGDLSFQANDEMETALLAGNSSESNQDEVDNTNAQVSIDSCLAYFTKPELLSNEHAWHCESCSKNVRCQRMEARNGEKQVVSRDKQSKTLKSRTNRGGSKSKNSPTGLDEGRLSSATFKTLDDEKPASSSTSATTVQTAHPHLVRLDVSDASAAQKLLGPTGEESTYTTHELRRSGNDMGEELLSNGVADHAEISWRDDDLGARNHAPQDLPHTSLNDQASFQSDGSKTIQLSSRDKDSFCEVDQVRQKESHSSHGGHETDDSEVEEINSGSGKVKRDATKRYLISKAPPILTIHLKRFSQDARGRLSKLSGHVSFRDTLDLWPYMDPGLRVKRSILSYLGIFHPQLDTIGAKRKRSVGTASWGWWSIRGP